VDHNPQSGIRAAIGAAQWLFRCAEFAHWPSYKTSRGCVYGVRIDHSKVGRFARPGDVLTIDGSELRVEEIAGTRIAKIKLTRQHETVGTVSRDIGLLTKPADLRQPEPVMAGHNHSHLEHAA
jgi:hypothetical protein